MKKFIILFASAFSLIALSQVTLDVPAKKMIKRDYTVTGAAQKNALENLWNAVDRPLKTNAVMLRIGFVRTVIKDTNGIPVLTNYYISAVDSVMVKLVEN